MKRLLTGLAALLPWLVLAADAQQGANIVETHELTIGWNAIYLEVTPANSSCEAVFKDYPDIISVGSYVSDAYSQTVQYYSDGTFINQKPVSYLVWCSKSAGSLSSEWETLRKNALTLNHLVGGHCYLVYAFKACTFKVTGRPRPPRMAWREATKKDDLYNLAGVSISEAATAVTVDDYFGEGPAGSGATLYAINGTNACPSNCIFNISAKASLQPGAAYLAPSSANRIWPGVINVIGADEGLAFGTNETEQLSFRLQNVGAKDHTFCLNYSGSGTGPKLLYQDIVTNSQGLAVVWTNLAVRGTVELKLEPQEEVSLTFAIDREDKKDAGEGILSITDKGASKMRVRLPVTMEEWKTPAATAWPYGIYMGSFELNSVTYSTNKTASTAGGTVKGTLLYYAENGQKPCLLQRICFGTVNGESRTFFCQDYEQAKKLSKGKTKTETSVRRVSSVVLDPQQPKIAAKAGFDEATAKDVTFAWTVGKHASTNPMRHSWHPDHDGVRYLTDGSTELAPDGDKLDNYKYQVKPELFSISNEVTLASRPRKGDGRCLDAVVSGEITWKLYGLKSENNGEIVCTGDYVLQRVSEAKLEDDK